MKREECTMTFSEALESYLLNRDECRAHSHRPDGIAYAVSARNMRLAAEHMDVLTAPVDGPLEALRDDGWSADDITRALSRRLVKDRRL